MTQVYLKQLPPPQPSTLGLLPPICGWAELLVLILIGQSVALMLAMASMRSMQTFWVDLGMISILVQWQVIACASLLCYSRDHLNRRPPLQAGLISFLMIMVCGTTINALAHQVQVRADATDLFGPFMLRSSVVLALCAAVLLRYLYVIRQWQQRIHSEAQARIQMLQARIHPHFLFNCMNTIASLTRQDPAKAEKAVENLSELFRFTMRDSAKLISLEQELNLVHRYLAIETERLGPKLRYHIENRAPPTVQIPALCIQPLVENAVLHGVETCVDPSPLVCEIDALPGKIRIKISNPVAFGQTHATSPSGLHLGLANIRERLHLWYGKAANLSIEVSQDRFNVVIEIPDVHDAQQSDYNR